MSGPFEEAGASPAVLKQPPVYAAQTLRKKGIEGMQSMKRIVAVLVGLIMTVGVLGCSANEGLRDGVQDGLASAIAALIEAPALFWINNTFAN